MTSLSLIGAMPPAPEPGSPPERIIDATLRCIGRWGMGKTTVDDIAREAGVGRATLYRLFPGGRDAVFDAVVATETARFFARLDDRLAAATTFEDALVLAIVEAAATLSGHAALQFLLAHEPEAILPHLAFQEMDAVLRSVAALGSPYLAPWLGGGDPESVARGVEWVTRIVLSYLIAPSADVDLCDPGAVRRLVRTYVLPGLVPGSCQAN